MTQPESDSEKPISPSSFVRRHLNAKTISVNKLPDGGLLLAGVRVTNFSGAIITLTRHHLNQLLGDDFMFDCQTSLNAQEQEDV